MFVEQVEETEGAGEGGSERLSPRCILTDSGVLTDRASRRLSKGSGLRLAMRAWAMELVSMCCGPER